MLHIFPKVIIRLKMTGFIISSLFLSTHNFDASLLRETEVVRAMMGVSKTIYCCSTVQVHRNLRNHKTFSSYSFNMRHFRPASACVLDLFCSTQTYVPFVGQRNSLCSASSGQTWFSSLQRAGSREGAHTVPTEMIHTEQRSK